MQLHEEPLACRHCSPAGPLERGIWCVSEICRGDYVIILHAPDRGRRDGAYSASTLGTVVLVSSNDTLHINRQFLSWRGSFGEGSTTSWQSDKQPARLGLSEVQGTNRTGLSMRTTPLHSKVSGRLQLQTFFKSLGQGPPSPRPQFSRVDLALHWVKRPS
jgi:hypothetical protein